METKKRSWWRNATAATLFAAVMALAPASLALGEVGPGDVTGMDHWYLTSEAVEEGAVAGNAEIDILAVAGSEGDTIYVDMDRNGNTIASHLLYEINEDTLESDENGDYVGVMSVSMFFDPKSTYGIKVFNDRDDGQLVYEGKLETVSGIFCTSEDDTNGKQVPILLRTIGESDNRPLDYPTVLTYENNQYTLKGEINGQPRYVITSSIPDTITGKVTYYEMGNSDNVLKTDEFTISKDEGTKLVHVDNIVEQNGEYFRSMQLTGAVTATYPGVTSFSIPCAKLTGEWGSAGKPYTANFHYVAVGTTDSIGNPKSIGLVDSLTIDKDYSYAPPKYLFFTNEDGTIDAWKLVEGEGQTATLDSNGAILLAPSKEEVEGGKLDVNIAYEAMGETSPAYWTIRLENGAVAAGDANRVLQVANRTIDPGKTATYKIPAELTGVDSNGTKITLVPVETNLTLSQAWDVNNLLPVSTVYYVPKDYEGYESYPVTLNLVDIATNSVISSVTRQANYDSEDRANVAFSRESDFPPNMVLGSKTYVRLDGQGIDIVHNYFNYDIDADGNKVKVYTIYYRDQNDTANANRVIRTVRTIYEGETDNGTTNNGTTTTNNGTKTTDKGTTNQGTTTSTLPNEREEVIYETAVIRLNDDGGLRTISSGGNAAAEAAEATLVNDAGETMADRVTEFLGGTDNPLANAAGNMVGMVETMNPLARVVMLCTLGIAIGCGLWWFFIYRKQKEEEEKEEQTKQS